jgi:outer membrane protein OmpA-like peptidoglycan-associated protein
MSSLAPGAKLRRKAAAPPAAAQKAPAATPAKPAGEGKKPASDGKKQAGAAAGASASPAAGAGQKPPAGTPGYLQAKLVVSHPQDAAEQEADQVAGQVRRAMRSPAGASTPAAKCAACAPAAPRGSLEPAITPPKKEVLSPKLMRATSGAQGSAASSGAASKNGAAKAGAGAGGANGAAGGADELAGKAAPARTEQRIAATRGQGAALPPDLRARLEVQLGRDLSAVRIHTDSQADSMCVDMHARAFTVGDDVYFSSGSYAPESDAGLELLAHELTHVGQQAEGGPQSAAPKLQRDFWDDVFGGGGAPADPVASCRKELDDAEKWASAGPHAAAPQGMVGAAGNGGFDAQYRSDPVEGAGVLDIRQNVAVEFKDTLVRNAGVVAPHPDLPATPEITALANRVNGIPSAPARDGLLSLYQWAPADEGPWISKVKTLVESTWGGQYSFFLNKPRWTWLGADVKVTLDIGPRAKAAGDHMTAEIYKTPPGESLRAFDIAHQVGAGDTADPHDQAMRLSSTAIGPKEYDLLRESVEFGFNSDVLTGAATTKLNAFIARFNGAVGNAAHQELRVEIVGHTSASGDEQYNLALSRRRADAVRDYLANNGFANGATRVTITPRGETDADQTQPKRAGDQRADLVVDGGERMITAAHEWGHAFGLDDEYVTEGTHVGDPVDHDAMAKAMTDANGAHLPGAIKEHNGGIMSLGTEVRPQHYATFHYALTTVTVQSPWSLGQHKPKWQVAMECGAPSPKGDWPTPAPNPPTPGTQPASSVPGSDDGSASA